MFSHTTHTIPTNLGFFSRLLLSPLSPISYFVLFVATLKFFIVVVCTHTHSVDSFLRARTHTRLEFRMGPVMAQWLISIAIYSQRDGVCGKSTSPAVLVSVILSSSLGVTIQSIRPTDEHSTVVARSKFALIVASSFKANSHSPLPPTTRPSQLAPTPDQPRP